MTQKEIRPQRPLRVGLCYDLKSDYLAAGFSPEDVLELDEEVTVAGIEEALHGLGHRVERIGRGMELTRRLAKGERWDLVFNTAEGMHGRSREAQVPAVCEMFGQPYTFSDPLTCALTLDKPLAKRLVRDSGLPTAAFAVVETEEDADAVDLPLPLFVKPASEGSSKGVTERSRVASRAELREACAELLRTFRQPVLVESYLAGRELTVGIVGNGAGAKVLGVMEMVFRGGDFYTPNAKEEFATRIEYSLLDGEPLACRAREIALGAYRTLACRDAARVDLRCDGNGGLFFLEINPLPGLQPGYSDLPILSGLAGMSYADLVGSIVEAAGRRWGLWS